MVRWLRWHCPPDTGFEIRALAVWGRARYLSVTEAPHNTDFHTWMWKKHFCFFQTAETGNRTSNSGVKGSGANHHPRAPALSSSGCRKTRKNKRTNERLIHLSLAATQWLKPIRGTNVGEKDPRGLEYSITMPPSKKVPKGLEYSITMPPSKKTPGD